MKTVVDYTKLINNKLLMDNKFVSTGYAFDAIYAVGVKSNTILLNASLGTKSLGYFTVSNLSLKYANGKFTLLTTAGKVTKISVPDSKTGEISVISPLYASKKLQTYKSAGSKKKSITIEKNSKFTIANVAVVKKVIYVKVKNTKGKTGWIALSTGKTAYVKQVGQLIWG